MPTAMPDIANHSCATTEGTLDWVGMSNIEVPLMLALASEAPRQVSASVEAFVNLKDPKAKGIHMSRLYLLLDELSTESTLSHATLCNLLDGFITSHEELSDQAFVKFDFELHLRRKALITEKQGWKAYPVTITGQVVENQLQVELKVNVPYSSTCPCSAALARQLIQETLTATKEPPAITRESSTARTETVLPAPGFHAVGTAVEAASSASRARGCPATVVNAPPM